MANLIAYTKNYTSILDEVYKHVACSTCLNSPRRMAHAGRNAKEIMVPKIEVSGLGDYTRNVRCKTGLITCEFETKMFNCDRGIKPAHGHDGRQKRRMGGCLVKAFRCEY